MLTKVPYMDEALNLIPAKIRNTVKLGAFGLTKVPMLLYLTPVVEELNERRCVVRIPLSYRSKNHLNSMYFGSMAAGADCAGGAGGHAPARIQGGGGGRIHRGCKWRRDGGVCGPQLGPKSRGVGAARDG